MVRSVWNGLPVPDWRPSCVSQHEFSLYSNINDEPFRIFQLHPDPFVTVQIRVSRWELFKGLFRKQFTLMLWLRTSNAMTEHVICADLKQLDQREAELAWRRLIREGKPV
jgi:hypothetical protein